VLGILKRLVPAQLRQQPPNCSHLQWVACPLHPGSLRYSFRPIVLDEVEQTFSVAAQPQVTASVAEMVERGIELILEVDAFPIVNPRVLYRAHGGAVGVVKQFNLPEEIV
jgi:hypothetical protein